jgi:hypothetical protein
MSRAPLFKPRRIGGAGSEAPQEEPRKPCHGGLALKLDIGQCPRHPKNFQIMLRQNSLSGNIPAEIIGNVAWKIKHDPSGFFCVR